VERSLDLRVLRKSGFVDPAGAARNIREILDLFSEFRDPDRLHTLLAMIHRHGAPDWCLGNLLVITNSLPLRRSLQQVLSNERALEFLTLLCSRTSKFTAILSREPLLFESMVGRPEDLLSAVRGWEFLRLSDPARYRTYNQFKAVSRYIVGETAIRGCTAELSDLAEELICASFESSVKEIPAARDVTFAVLALGKLGGGEISIGSDLDIIFLYKERPGLGDAKTAVAVGRMLRETLEGVYEVDYRLRPEGKNSPLATEYEYYKRYLLERASLWERQSLARARVLAGEPAFIEELDRHVREFVYQTPLPNNWNKDILSMRQRMAREHTRTEKSVNLKTGEGGLADLEFLVQFLQLRYGHNTPLIARSNTFDALEEIQRARILKKSDSGKAVQNLDSLRRLEAFVRLNSETSDFILPSDKSRLQAIAAAMGLPSCAALIARVERMCRENHALFTTTLKKQLV
jgi:glutamate-ammonia-ligase adenylyltransferase